MHPIRILMPGELALYRDHLLCLGSEDRRLRFGYPRDDDAVRNYVDGLQPSRDAVLAHFGAGMEVIGAVHVALCARNVAEFAFSVDADHRRCGIGAALFARAVDFARNRGVASAVIYCLAENRQMRSLARKARMTISTSAGDSEGAVELPPATPASMVGEMVSEHAGLCDYALKANRRAVRTWCAGMHRAA